MLAALIATRSIPAPVRKRYGNQFIAATTTFACIAINKKAAFITTSPTIRHQLSLSIPGQDCTFDRLNLLYYQLINQYSTDLPDYLSSAIANTIDVVVLLTAILQTLPVAPSSAPFLANLQHRLAIALSVLKSLAIPFGS